MGEVVGSRYRLDLLVRPAHIDTRIP
jgi:hypothetical protein